MSGVDTKKMQVLENLKKTLKYNSTAIKNNFV